MPLVSPPRRRFRLGMRLLTAFVVVVGAALALVITVVDARHHRVMVDLHRDKGLALGRSVAAASANSLLSYNYVALQQLSQRIVHEEGLAYVIILDKEGKVAGYSGRPDWQGRELTDTVSQRACDASKVLVQEAQNESLGEYPGLDITVPVYVEGSPQRWGQVRVGLSLDRLHAVRGETQRWVLGLGVVVLGLAALVAQLLARRVTQPLRQLVEATAEIARGNFDHRVAIRTGDEIEDLSDRFDRMADEVRERQNEVEQANEELAVLNQRLEEKVDERTRELVEAEQKYRILVESSPNPICIVQNSRLDFFNRAFAETFGYRAEELEEPGFDPAVLLDPEESPNPFTTGGLREGDEYSGEVVGLHRDGGRITLDMRSTAIAYRGDLALEAILVDVTEHRQLHEQAVAYERLRALGEMAGGVAHDFNNVLGAILGRAQLLRRLTGDRRLHDGLGIIEKAAQDGAETVKRIQDFTRVRKERDFAPVDLNGILGDVIEMTRVRWSDGARREGKRVEVRRELTDPLPRVAGHISELREVFTNLLINAVDAIPGEGTLTVRTGHDEDIVWVEVEDTGAGMSPEVQRRLFDPFYTTKGAEGTGLGMSIVYGIVERHDATIDVTSAEDEGTCFRLEFAVDRSSDLPQEETWTDSPEPAEGGRVLVVDDEQEIRALIREILIEAGYEVQVAEDGEDAIRRLEAEPFDLVFTDLGMPGVSGWEVARCANELDDPPGVILVTGWGATLEDHEVVRNGVDLVLKKPFPMLEILRAAAETARLREIRRSA